MAVWTQISILTPEATLLTTTLSALVRRNQGAAYFIKRKIRESSEKQKLHKNHTHKHSLNCCHASKQRHARPTYNNFQVSFNIKRLDHPVDRLFALQDQDEIFDHLKVLSRRSYVNYYIHLESTVCGKQRQS